MKKHFTGKTESLKWILFAVLGVLIAVVIVLSLFTRDIVYRSRAQGEYTVVEQVTAAQLDGQREYRFTLGQMEHDQSLAFFINHHEVVVFLGEECVYSLTTTDDRFATVGGTWVSLPLYVHDSGKQVRVVLTPLYDDYTKEVPEFLVGSEIAIHNATLHRALPALALSLCAMFAGFLLIYIAVYHSAKGIYGGRLYALGLMAISTGSWRLTYDRVAYLLMPDYAVTVYTVSLISMMVMALAMLNSVQTEGKGKRAVHICSSVYCGVYIVQLLMQALGVADLRQTLKLIHITIIISAAAFLLNGVRRYVYRQKTGKHEYEWMLGVGVLIDLVMYYMDMSSLNVIFTLIAILCYSLLEGIALLFTYVERERALEEMKMQLTLSRTTTMMSQIRSHFVFNVLNAISGLCKYDPEKADETVIRFARYLRNNIDIMEKDGNIPFATDLRQLEDYVALEQVRFGDKVEFYTDIEVSNFMIPPLILQPVVENAIKHGISKKMGNGSIILRTRQEQDKIVITVDDDGVGFDLAQLQKEKSVGVRNIRFRLEHLAHGTLDIQSTVGKGTTVTITIPKETM